MATDPITRVLIRFGLLSKRQRATRFAEAVAAVVRAEHRKLVEAVERDKLDRQRGPAFAAHVDQLTDAGMWERWQRVHRVVLDEDEDGKGLHLFGYQSGNPNDMNGVAWLDHIDLAQEIQVAESMDGEEAFAEWLRTPRPFRLLLLVRSGEHPSELRACLAGDAATPEAIEAAWLSGGLEAVLAMGRNDE